MNRDFLKGVKFTLGIIFTLSLLGLVYAVGFHIAEEVLPGTFTGDYTFNGTLNLSSTTVIGLDATPVGAIMAFNLSSCPTSWIPADGTSGTPDLRGQFLRGLNSFDGGATNRSDGKEDPDGFGRLLGSWQNESFLSHTHTAGPVFGNVGNSYGGTNSRWRIDSAGVGVSTSAGDNETRPKNVGVIYCIKN